MAVSWSISNKLPEPSTKKEIWRSLRLINCSRGATAGVLGPLVGAPLSEPLLEEPQPMASAPSAGKDNLRKRRREASMGGAFDA